MFRATLLIFRFFLMVLLDGNVFCFKFCVTLENLCFSEKKYFFPPDRNIFCPLDWNIFWHLLSPPGHLASAPISQFLEYCNHSLLDLAITSIAILLYPFHPFYLRSYNVFLFHVLQCTFQCTIPPTPLINFFPGKANDGRQGGGWFHLADFPAVFWIFVMKIRVSCVEQWTSFNPTTR